MKKSYLATIALIISQLCIGQVTVVLTADKDNTVYSAFTGNSNGAGEYLFAGKNAASNNNSVQRALVHFNTSAIPAGAVVTAATLTLSVDRSGPNSTGLELHRAAVDWGEGTSNAADLEASGAAATAGDATWLQRIFPATNWTTPGGNYSPTASATVSVAANVRALTPFAFTGPTVLADVQSWVTNNTTNQGWFVVATNEALSASVKRIISRNSAALTALPVLSVTYTVALPVTLTSFTGSAKGNTTLLQWKTTSEVNNSYFEVERSKDGIQFQPIGRITATTNPTNQNAYTFTDNAPLKGGNYYRLAQVDRDGTTRFSNVINLSTRPAIAITVKPNPVAEVLNIQGITNLNGLKFQIISANGQSAMNGTLGSTAVRVAQLKAGQYWLSIQLPEGEVLKTSFLKN